jgi:D-alanyl-D-alanine dipeptidase
MRNFFFLVLSLLLFHAVIDTSFSLAVLTTSSIPYGFVYLHDVDSSIVQEMRYAEDHNFIGSPLPGYLAPKCILTKEAASNLEKVQLELKEYGMSLKVYDCYRPQKAVNRFVSWAKDLEDHKMKAEFYPKVEKTQLFEDGYIAEKSGHSRGSTVDLTIILDPPSSQAMYLEKEPLKACYLPLHKRFKDNSLDFGTGFDCFDPLAHTENPQITALQKQRRLMLKTLMDKHGFKNLTEEWWHYTLKNEPFPSQYFDFDVQ